MDTPVTPWYQDGLRFTCTQCGNCCTGAPGYVWVSPEEIQALAASLGLETDAFSRKFVRRVGSRYSLIERPNGECIFWKSDRGCTVYGSRPVQCRPWPSWSENLETPDDWRRVHRGCPGAGQGDFFPLDAIEDAVRRTPQ